jgi:DNA-binding response OmpR family regulator
MRLLLIEDDTRVVDFLERGLKAEAYVVVCADNGPEGLAIASERCFSAIILDINLPGMDGFSVCQELRHRGIFTPVLMLTARDTVEDRVRGLRLGGDDYLCKPFAFDELLARLSALIRRADGLRVEPAVSSVGDLTFDHRARSVRRGDVGIALTAKELAILEILIRSPGSFFSREKLLSMVWGCDVDPLTNIVEVYMARLRKKLNEGGRPPLIQSLRGLGYKIDAGQS